MEKAGFQNGTVERIECSTGTKNQKDMEDKMSCDDNENENFEKGLDIDKEDALHCWKVAVDQVNQIGKRRSEVNAFFVSIISLLFTGEFFGLGILSDTGNAKMLVCTMSLFGIVVCVLWWMEVGSLRRITNVKYQIIHMLEDKFGGCVFKAEYALHYAKTKLKLEQVRKCGVRSCSLFYQDDGKNVFGHIEGCVPWIFVFLFVALAVGVFLGFIQFDNMVEEESCCKSCVKYFTNK